jgi:hypothetical protein
VAPSSSIAPRAPIVQATPKKVAAVAASITPATTSPRAVVSSTPVPSPKIKEPEVRRAEPVRPEDLAKAGVPETLAESNEPNRVAIKPLKKTYIKVVVDNESVKPAFERWISPTDGTVEFSGQHIAVRVLDRDAIQIKKNGKLIADGDTDVTVE